MCGAPCTPRVQYGKSGVLLRPVRTPPAHPSAARARGLPRIPQLHRQAVYRGCRSTHLARRYPRMPQLRPVALRPHPTHGQGAPRGCRGSPGVHVQAGYRGCRSSDRWPGPPSHGQGRRGRRGILGCLGVNGGHWTPRCPWSPWGHWRPWGADGDLGHRGVLEGPRGAWGTLGSLGVDGERREAIIAKTVFGACLRITDS